MHRLILALLMPLLAWYGPAQAQLTIEVTGGVEGAQPIAVVPFGASDGAIPGVDVGAVISADLARSGRFKPMPARDMLATPHSAVRGGSTRLAPAGDAAPGGRQRHPGGRRLPDRLCAVRCL